MKEASASLLGNIVGAAKDIREILSFGPNHEVQFHVDGNYKGNPLEDFSVHPHVGCDPSPWELHRYRLALAAAVERIGAFIVQKDEPLITHTEGSDRIAQELRDASIVMWREDLRLAAIEGADLFKGQPFEASALRFGPQAWFYEHSIGVNLSDQGTHLPGHYCLGATLLFAQKDFDGVPNVVSSLIFVPELRSARKVVLEYQERGEKVPTHLIQPRIASRWIAQGQPLNDWIDCVAMAKMSFMNQEIVTAEPIKHSRQVRRQAERKKQTLPDIRVIQLRRQHHKAAAAGAGAEGGAVGEPGREYSCQWLVGSHWRNQWFPSTQSHKPVFIRPYVKGPEDKPFRESSPEKIFVVRR